MAADVAIDRVRAIGRKRFVARGRLQLFLGRVRQRRPAASRLSNCRRAAGKFALIERVVGQHLGEQAIELFQLQRRQRSRDRAASIAAPFVERLRSSMHVPAKPLPTHSTGGAPATDLWAIADANQRRLGAVIQPIVGHGRRRLGRLAQLVSRQQLELLGRPPARPLRRPSTGRRCGRQSAPASCGNCRRFARASAACRWPRRGRKPCRGRATRTSSRRPRPAWECSARPAAGDTLLGAARRWSWAARR